MDCLAANRLRSLETCSGDDGPVDCDLIMDGKAKKRLEVIKQKLQLLQQKLAGAKRQDDEPGEVRNLELEIAALQAEATKLRA